MKSLNLFKNAIISVLTIGSTMVIAACYGVYNTSRQLAFGRVTQNNDGVENVYVCITPKTGENMETSDEQCTVTATDGSYMIYGIEADKNALTSNGGNICATYPRNTTNPDFHKCKNIAPSEKYPIEIHFSMDSDGVTKK